MEETSPSKACWEGHPCCSGQEPVGEEQREKELAGSKFSAGAAVLNWVRAVLISSHFYHSLSPAISQIVTAIKRGQTQSQV